MAILDQVDASGVYYVAFTHCPALVMPRSLANFRNLKGLELYNSTLVEWSAQNALKGANNPHIFLVYLTRVNLTAIPPGLLHPEFPPTLMDVEMSVVNISTLPDEVVTVWPKRMAYLYWENSNLTQIPPIVGKMHIEQLSFASNRLVRVPSALFTSHQFLVYSLADNPQLEDMPDDIGDLSLLQGAQLDHTAIRKLPTWMESVATPPIYGLSATGTPFCDQVLQERKTGGSMAVMVKSVQCAPVKDRATITWFPLEIKDRYRSLVDDTTAE